jgi:cytochrome c biogenesis protein CcdA
MKFSVSNNVVIGILAIVAGLLILAFPELLRWVVGIFLIVWGILTLLGKK